MAACYQINGTSVINSSRTICNICTADVQYMQAGIALFISSTSDRPAVAGGLQYCNDGNMYYSDGSDWYKLGGGGGEAREIAVDGAYGFFDMRECQSMCRTTTSSYSYGWPFH